MPVSHLGQNDVVETGAVLLGPDDADVRFTIFNSTFFISFVQDPNSPGVACESISADKIRVKVNAYRQTNPTFKVKVGQLWHKDLYLAVRSQSSEDYRLLTYTFSIKGT
jgi:hypothetical protein